MSAALPLRRSLRARGMLATLALLGYFALAGSYVADERARLNESVQALEGLAQHEKAMALAEAAVGAARSAVREAAAGASVSPDEIAAQVGAADRQLAALEAFDADYARWRRAIERGAPWLDERHAGTPAAPPNPLPPAAWAGLRDALDRAVAQLEIRRGHLAGEREALIGRYRHHFDAITVETLVLGVFGVVGFGSLAGLFFARLAHDIARLEAHARGIVAGRRGAALEVRRDDELGRLMRSVNRMAVDLDEREQRLAREALARSHHEQMAAVGALAAGMAHEVNNPLAAIAGHAQALRDRSAGDDAAQAEAILAQADRAARAAHALAEAAAPQPDDIDWFDLGALLTQTLRWLAYDRRWRGQAIDVAGARALPALRGSAAALQQLLMQLLPLACEAARRAPPQRVTGEHAQPRVTGEHAQPRVWIDAHHDEPGATVELRISFPADTDFEARDAQRVAAVRTLLVPLHAALAFGQDENGKAHATLRLPMDSLAANDHPA